MEGNNLLRARVKGLELSPTAQRITLDYSLAHVWLEVPTSLRFMDRGADLSGSERPRLEYRCNDPFRKVELVGEEVADCFWSFLNLSEASDHKILTYAQRFGVLRIGPYGSIRSRDGQRMDYGTGIYRDVQYPVTSMDGSELRIETTSVEEIDYWYMESTRDWRAYSRMLGSALVLATTLLNRQKTALEDWQNILEPQASASDLGAVAWPGGMLEYNPAHEWRGEHPPDHNAKPTDLLGDEASQLSIFEDFITSLMIAGGLLPRLSLHVTPNGFRPQVTLAPERRIHVMGESGYHQRLDPPYASDLFSVLCGQLVAILVSANGVAICDECSSIYQPSRRPRPDRRHYCLTCQQDANLAAKRRSYHANKSKWPSVVSRKRADAVAKGP